METADDPLPSRRVRLSEMMNLADTLGRVSELE